MAAVGRNLPNLVCLFSAAGRQVLHEQAVLTTKLLKVELRKRNKEIAALEMDTIGRLMQELRSITDQAERNRMEKMVQIVIYKFLGEDEPFNGGEENQLSQTDQCP
jgi:arginine decarboxylase-like protein